MCKNNFVLISTLVISLQNQMLFGKGEARPVWEDAEDKLELELTPSLFVHPLQSSLEGTESPTPHHGES